MHSQYLSLVEQFEIDSELIGEILEKLGIEDKELEPQSGTIKALSHILNYFKEGLGIDEAFKKGIDLAINQPSSTKTSTGFDDENSHILIEKVGTEIARDLALQAQTAKLNARQNFQEKLKVHLNSETFKTEFIEALENDSKKPSLQGMRPITALPEDSSSTT